MMCRADLRRWLGSLDEVILSYATRTIVEARPPEPYRTDTEAAPHTCRKPERKPWLAVQSSNSHSATKETTPS